MIQVDFHTHVSTIFIKFPYMQDCATGRDLSLCERIENYGRLIYLLDQLSDEFGIERIKTVGLCAALCLPTSPLHLPSPFLLLMPVDDQVVRTWL